MNLVYLKWIHIVFVVTWFAGLFYIVRLFIYHTEANEKPEPDRSILINHFKVAERRLLFGITFPSMILTYILGLTMAFEMFGTDFQNWLWIKLYFVFGLTLYHFSCHWIYADLKKGKFRFTSQQLRMWNEVATLFLFAIVYIVVVRDENWQKILKWIGIFTFVLYGAVFIYKKIRTKAQ